jgi:hypothetical protein
MQTLGRMFHRIVYGIMIICEERNMTEISRNLF